MADSHAPDESVLERYQLPILLGSGLALYGASRFDATRPLAGVLLAYGVPIGAVLKGGAPLRESSLRSWLLTIGTTVVVATDVLIARAYSPPLAEALASLPAAPVLLGVLLLSAAAAVGLQAAGAKRGLRNHFAAWVGIVTMLGVYLPTHAKAGTDILDAFVAAFLVSLFVGGGAGLLLGALATKMIRAPKSDRA